MPSISGPSFYTLLPTSPTRQPLLQAHPMYKEHKPERRYSLDAMTIETARAIVASPLYYMRKRGTLAIIGCIFALCFLLGWESSVILQVRRTASWSISNVGITSRGKVAVNFDPFDVPDEWKCNPFKEPGRLVVNLTDPVGNYWEPYEEECAPSRLLKGLIEESQKAKTKIASRSLRKVPLRMSDASHHSRFGKTGLLYPWLVNATILLQGDSMERLHLNDFCNFVGGKLENISPKHPAHVGTVRKELPTILNPEDGTETQESINAKVARIQAEDFWENRENSWFYTRPWLCNIQEYNATIISVFAWGMADMEPVYQFEDFFHGPSTWVQRFHQITLPLLHNLASYLDRPQILHPDLIELGSGFWDLRGFTEQDFIAAGVPKPYPESDIPFRNIGSSRGREWASNAQAAIKEVATHFSGGKNGDGSIRNGPPISWRTLHHPKKNNYTPYSRAAELDQLARKTLHDLRVGSLKTHPDGVKAVKERLLKTKNFLLHHQPQQRSMTTKEVDYGFDERLRVNEIGSLLLGQEEQFKDFLHPNPVPGSYLWGDTILYELKRARMHIGRSA